MFLLGLRRDEEGSYLLILKSDNEPAIVKLLAEVLRDLRIEGLEQLLEENGASELELAQAIVLEVVLVVAGSGTGSRWQWYW